MVECHGYIFLLLRCFKVCKHFLHAIEKGIYGWFWECPSGDKCIYRHALPPGFVFKKQLKEQEELQPQDTITLEELVEKEVKQGEIASSLFSTIVCYVERGIGWFWQITNQGHSGVISSMEGEESK